MRTIDDTTLRRQIAAVFESWGMAREHVETTVHVMVETDLAGIDSHGVGMLPYYQKAMEEGLIEPKPAIRMERETGALALIDAGRSLGHPPAMLAMRTAMDKARKVGAAAVAVRNSNHYGAAGYYSKMAAEDGLLGLSLTNAPTRQVAPMFGADAALGTNPIGFAAPAEANRPFALDMATSTVAFGKVSIARRAGKALPEGWMVDRSGAPVTDAQLGLEVGRLTPLGGTRELGGHKGYGLGAMVEILCATLSGCLADETGHFFFAIDPSQLRGEGEFEADLDRLLDMLRATPPVDPGRPVMTAGDPGYAAYAERKANGIPMTDTLFEELRDVCSRAGAAFLLEGQGTPYGARAQEVSC